MNPVVLSASQQQLLRESKYKNEGQRLVVKYPNLGHNDHKLWTHRQYHPLGQLACITFSDDGQPPDVCHLSGEDAVIAIRTELLKDRTATGPLRRLFLLEGCYDERTTVLGAYLRIPHLFWMRHAKVAMWEPNVDDAGNLPPLPSTTFNSDSFALSYCQMMRLGDGLEDFALRCAENERHIALSRTNRKLDGIGAVHRRVSVWSRKTERDGWDVVMVVDVPLKKALGGRRESWSLIESKQIPAPFQGGYADFIPYDNLDDLLETQGPPRTSTFDDLLYYHTTHWSALKITPQPRSVTTFAEKLIASEYVLLIQYYRALLCQLQWSLSRHSDFGIFDSQWVAESWSDLMSFQRRLQDHLASVQTVRTSLGTRPTSCAPSASRLKQEASKDWSNSLPDFEYVECQISALIQQTVHLVTAFTALSGAKAAEQSLFEAHSVRTLTILGVIFLPLSVIAAIFSMSDQYRPGGPKFWVYFAVAIPLTTVFVLAAIVSTYGLAVDDWRQKKTKQSSAPREYKEYRDTSLAEAHALRLGVVRRELANWGDSACQRSSSSLRNHTIYVGHVS